jgi:outer membrane receptor protein involved in Fe transport
MTAAQYGNVDFGTAAQYDSNVGGNINLKPEKSDTLSIGAVIVPGDMLRGFSLTVDWFNITVKNYLAPGLSASFVIAQCGLNTGPVATDPLCQMIHRSSGGDFQNGDGTSGVDQFWLNTGKLKVQGIDFSAAYSTEIGSMGKLSFDLNGTLMDKFTSNPIPGSSQSYNCVGYFGAVCTVPVAKWRHTLRTNWKTPIGVMASLNWRYNGAVKNDADHVNPILEHKSVVAPEDLHIGAYSYFDLALTWDATKFLTLRGGINNLFDKRPPIISTAAADAVYSNGNTYPGIYDPLGRLVHMSATVKF